MDIKTLLLLIFFFQLITLVFFGFNVIFSNFKNKLITYYTLGRISLTISASLAIFVPNLTYIWISLISFFAFTGMTFELFCLMNVNREPNIKSLIRIQSYTLICSLLYFIFSTNMVIKLLITSLFFASIFGYFVYNVIKSNILSKIKLLINIIGIAFVISNIVRALYSVTTSNNIDLTSTLVVNQIWLILLLIITATFPTSFLLIINEEESLKLKQINSIKDKFFKIIARDLREPIAQMITATEVLERNFKDFNEENMYKILNIIRSSSERGLNLLENLLNWAQSQTNSIEFNPEMIDVTNIIDENINLLQRKANEKNIEIVKMKWTSEMIKADKNMLTIVIKNLLSKAIKNANPGGQVNIKTQIKNEVYEFSVQDNGVEINHKSIKDLFMAESLHVGIGTNEEKGTGIGLVLCKEFIKKHNGDIWVTTKEGLGNTFTFTIPSK